MSLWEKAILNVERGGKKAAATAAVFSERVKAELAIIRLKLRISDGEAAVGALHRKMGARLAELLNRNELPKTTEQLLKDDAVAELLAKLSKRTAELEALKSDLKDIKIDVETAQKETEDQLS
jgi:hypothetical protein